MASALPSDGCAVSDDVQPQLQSPAAASVPQLKLDEGSPSLKVVASLESVFKSWCGSHDSMDGRAFVKVCKRACLVDKVFTSRDCHLIFSGAVPLEKQRMDLPIFKTALSDIAAKKGLKEFLVRRMVTWSQLPQADRDVQECSEVNSSTARGEREIDAGSLPEGSALTSRRKVRKSKSATCLDCTPRKSRTGARTPTGHQRSERPSTAGFMENGACSSPEKSLSEAEAGTFEVSHNVRHQSDAPVPSSSSSASDVMMQSKPISVRVFSSMPLTSSMPVRANHKIVATRSQSSAAEVTDDPRSISPECSSSSSSSCTNVSGNAGVSRPCPKSSVWSSMPLMQVRSRRPIWGVDAPGSSQGLRQSSSCPALHEDLQPASSGVHLPHP